MRAIILAAGRGMRLQQADGQQLPKCLLRFGGVSLLERHLRRLNPELSGNEAHAALARFAFRNRAALQIEDGSPAKYGLPAGEDRSED